MRKKEKEKVRYVLVNDGYDIPSAEAASRAESDTDTDTDTEIEDETDLRLECLKLAVAFAKTKDQVPIPIAKQFLAFVLAQEPAAPSTEGQEADGRTSP